MKIGPLNSLFSYFVGTASAQETETSEPKTTCNGAPCEGTCQKSYAPEDIALDIKTCVPRGSFFSRCDYTGPTGRGVDSSSFSSLLILGTLFILTKSHPILALTSSVIGIGIKIAIDSKK